MGFFRRDGRLRPATLWALFVVALLLGAAVGWGYGLWSRRTIRQEALDVAKDLQHAVDRVTK